MFKVLCDNALMCDSRIEELALINPIVKLEENKAGSFSFKIPPSHPFYGTIQKRKTIVEVYLDEKDLVFSGMCIEAKKDLHNQEEIYCEGELSYLNDSIQRPVKYTGKSVRGLLEAYIASHNAQVESNKHFQVGQVTVVDSNDSISCYTNMESTMKAIKEDLLDDLGGIIRIRHEDGVKYIDYLADSPYTNTQVIKLGKNLIDFKSNIDSSEIATAIIPLGTKLEESAVEGLETRLTIESVNGGHDYVHSPEAVDAYGWIYKTVVFDGVTQPQNLKQKGEQYLSETQFENVVIEAKAIDLHLADKSIERFKISDQIRVSSAPHGLNKYFRLTKQTLNLNNPENDTITLGKSEKVTLSAKSTQIGEEMKRAIEAIVPANVIVNEAVANATALITASMGGYVVKTNNELLIMDTDNVETATKVWRWNINGLGYSSTGYNGEYSLAMTMDGKIVADMISTGKIVSADRSTYFDLDHNQIMSSDGVYEMGISNGGINIKRNNEGRVAIFASGNENDTGAIRMVSANGNNVLLYADGLAFNTEGSGGQYGNITTTGKVTAGTVEATSIEATEQLKATSIEATGQMTAGSFVSKNKLGELKLEEGALVSSNVYNQCSINGGQITLSPVMQGVATSIKLENAIHGEVDISNSSISVGSASFFPIDREVSAEINNKLFVFNDLWVSGTKSRVATTENYDDRLLYCYEMPSPYFGDLGEGELDESGICYVDIDDVFAETVDTSCKYQVFLQKYSEGEAIVTERCQNYFVVKGTPNMKFAWEIKAKQAGYTMERLDKFTETRKDDES